MNEVSSLTACPPTLRVLLHASSWPFIPWSFEREARLPHGLLNHVLDKEKEEHWQVHSKAPIFFLNSISSNKTQQDCAISDHT